MATTGPLLRSNVRRLNNTHFPQRRFAGKKTRTTMMMTRMMTRMKNTENNNNNNNNNDNKQRNQEIKRATADAEIRGAACVRALCFYQYPKDRSEYSIRAHRMTKIDSEFDTIQLKLKGEDVSYKNTTVYCYVAIEDRDLSLDERAPEDPSIVIPGTNQIVCGTLDINVGINLPAEELVGRYPVHENLRSKKRCYLSNVCVLESRRKLGIARKLIERVIEDARKEEIAEIYVHVVAENVTAKRLYEKIGFVVEAEETSKEALARMHPARQILRYQKPL